MRYHEFSEDKYKSEWSDASHDEWQAEIKKQNKEYKQSLLKYFGPNAKKKDIIWWVDYEMLGLGLQQKKYQKQSRAKPKFKKTKKIILELLKHYSLTDVVKIKKAMGLWSTSHFARHNNSLRAGKTPAATKYMDMYMEHGPKFQGGTVYRGLDGTFFKSLKKGMTFFDPGYSAASTDPSIAKYFAMRGIKGGVFEIKGAANLAVLPMGTAVEENEVLFPRNTKFKILDIADATVGEPAKATVQVSK